MFSLQSIRHSLRPLCYLRDNVRKMDNVKKEIMLQSLMFVWITVFAAESYLS